MKAREKESIMNQLATYKANGYKVVNENNEEIVLRKNNATIGGHVIVFILGALFWYGMGYSGATFLTNILYHVLMYRSAKIIKG